MKLSLSDLSDLHGSDKGNLGLVQPGQSSRGPGHQYAPFYEKLFAGRTVRALLEIGVLWGASLRIWADYFPEAKIFGIDYNPLCQYAGGRIQTVVCDQSDAPALMHAAANFTLAAGGLFDIIIDDGSHIPAHQLASAIALHGYLALGSVYVIEDVTPEGVLLLARELPWKFKVQEFGPLAPFNRIAVIEKGRL